MLVEKMVCKTCSQSCIKYGKTVKGTQRYYCNSCKKTQQKNYQYKACRKKVNNHLTSLLKEGCGIRSISRLLAISTTTTMARILTISNQVKSPVIVKGKTYVATSKTFIENTYENS